MPPPDFSGGPAAFVELGDGSAHDPQIKFTADDNSCRWNGFPVCIDAEIFQPIVPATPAPSFQVSQFITTPGAGSSAPTEAQWPKVYIYDYLNGLLSGYDLAYRMRFTETSGGTSLGSAAIQSQVGSCDHAQPGPITGVFDSGVTPVNFSCLSCSTAPDGSLNLGMVFSNFNPTSGSAIVNAGRLDITWRAVPGFHIPEYAPFQHFTIRFVPPGCLNDPSGLSPGLYITLETSSCGLLTKTYTNVASAVNALSLGITASILGGHGSDIAKPDPSCPAPDYCCDMAGAVCSGSVDN